MSIAGSCHCGAVLIEAPAAPEWAASCNCSLCRKLGWLVAIYPDAASVRVEGETVPYLTGSRSVEFRHCAKCGCATHWVSLIADLSGAGINARLLDGYSEKDGRSLFEGRELEVRYMDNADR